MKWKLELDALIESTMAFAKDIKRGQPIADLPDAMRTAEQALAETSRERVSSFKKHQEKMARDREEYYLQVRVRMLVPVDPSGVRSEINPREP